ncbi:MAG: hypothetical protein ACT4QF_01920 [Sporichthyaceae bacterium]
MASPLEQPTAAAAAETVPAVRGARFDRAEMLSVLGSARWTKLPPTTGADDAVLDRLRSARRSESGPTVDLPTPVITLADLLTLAEHTQVPLPEVAVCYVGDGRTERAASLLLAGAVLGMDVRIAAPPAMWPADADLEQAEDIAAVTGARLLVTSDAGHAVLGADGVLAGSWDGRSVLAADLVAPAAYTVDAALLASCGVAGVVTLVLEPSRRIARGAPCGGAGDQVRNRRVVADLLRAMRRGAARARVLPLQRAGTLPEDAPAYETA